MIEADKNTGKDEELKVLSRAGGIPSGITGGSKKERPIKADQLHGHPDFYRLLERIAKLHSDKNYDYAAGGDPLGNFKRRATLYGMYPNLDLSDPAVIALVDAMKQLDAALWMYSNKHEAKVEGKVERLLDNAVYSLLSAVMEGEKGKKEEDTDWNAEAKQYESEMRMGQVIDPPLPKIKPCHSNCSGIAPLLKNDERYYWVSCPICDTIGLRGFSIWDAIVNWNAGARFGGRT